MSPLAVLLILLSQSCVQRINLGSRDAGQDGGEVEVPECTAACAPVAGECECSEMVSLPGGTFMMGCTSTDEGCVAAEQPLHEVTLSPFELDRTEVTQAAYAACTICAAPRCGLTAGEDPVTCLSYSDAKVYCAWRQKRLPTEAEWEYAARLDAGRYPWGDAEPDCDRALYGACGLDSPEPAGARPHGATPAGVLGLADNVRELTEDRWSPGFYSESAASNPVCTTGGVDVSVRGGAFDSPATALRSSKRGSHAAILSGAPNIGFRCAR